MANDAEFAAQIERAVGGDADALSELLEQSAVSLHDEIDRKIGARYRGMFAAEDVLQVTYLEAFLHIRAFAPGGPSSFAAWLRRMADNNLKDAIRELERDKRPSPGKRVDAAVGNESYVALVERLAATTTTPSRVATSGEARAAVERAMRQLPPDYQTVLRLYEIEGLSGPEVAGRMQRSHGAVRMMLARAREGLAAVIGSESQFFESGA